MPGPPPASTSKGSALSRGCPGPMRWQWPDRPVSILFFNISETAPGGSRRASPAAGLDCHPALPCHPVIEGGGMAGSPWPTGVRVTCQHWGMSLTPVAPTGSGSVSGGLPSHAPGARRALRDRARVPRVLGAAPLGAGVRVPRLRRDRGVAHRARAVDVRGLWTSGVGDRGHHFPGDPYSVVRLVPGDLVGGQPKKWPYGQLIRMCYSRTVSGLPPGLGPPVGVVDTDGRSR